MARAGLSALVARWHEPLGEERITRREKGLGTRGCRTPSGARWARARCVARR